MGDYNFTAAYKWKKTLSFWNRGFGSCFFTSAEGKISSIL